MRAAGKTYRRDFGRTLPLETEGALCRSVRRVAGRDRRVACATLIRYPEVPQELKAAALWYEDRQPGLGGDFLEEYHATLRYPRPDCWTRALSH